MAKAPRGKLQAVSKTDATHGGEGYCIVPHALFRHRQELNLDSNAILVLVAIITRTSGFDEVTVAVSTIVSDTDLSASTVKRTLKRLRDLGLIIAGEHRWIGPNKSATNKDDLRPLAARLRAIAEARISPTSSAATLPPASLVASTAPADNVPQGLFGTPNYSPEATEVEPDESGPEGVSATRDAAKNQDASTNAEQPQAATKPMNANDETAWPRTSDGNIDWGRMPVGSPLPGCPKGMPGHVFANLLSNIKVSRIKNEQALAADAAAA